MNWKKLKKILPWNRPTLADLPPDERRKARLLMWGAGAGVRFNSEDGGIKVTLLDKETGEERT